MAGILSIKIRADATPFERSLKTVGRNITSFAQKSLAVGRGISLGFTAPLMAIGASAVNAAADFDSSSSVIVILHLLRVFAYSKTLFKFFWNRFSDLFYRQST